MGRIVSNTYLGSDLGTDEQGLVAATATTPDQIYRNTDNKYFEPHLIVATNRSATNMQRLMLVDCDTTDSGEDTYKGEAYVKYEIYITPETTAVIPREELLGLSFRYGVAGYQSAVDALGISVYISGEEI